MTRFDSKCFSLARATDGTYDLDGREGEIIDEFFGIEDNGRWDRIHDVIKKANRVRKLPVTMEVQGWTRPVVHVLLDLIDAARRMTGVRAWRELLQLGDDREWFIGRAASGIVLIDHEIDPGDKFPLPVSLPAMATGSSLWDTPTGRRFLTETSIAAMTNKRTKALIHFVNGRIDVYGIDDLPAANTVK
jgi:hypothetical protein